jgi:drug/metabolite transporter (DMT)-like permease
MNFVTSSILIFTAIGVGSIFQKLALNYQESTYVVMFHNLFWGVLFSFPLILLDGNHNFETSFWLFFVIRLVLGVIGQIYFFKALNIENISYALPMITLNAVFSGLLAVPINGQKLKAIAWVGIIVITIGVLLLNYAELNLTKDKTVVKKGLLYIAIVVASWSVLNPIHSEGVERSSPEFYFFTSFLGMTIFAFVLVQLKAKGKLKKSFRDFKALKLNVAVGLATFISYFGIVVAVENHPTGAVISMTQLSVLISSLYGVVFLKEKINLFKVVGITAVISGAILVIYFVK